MKAGYKRTEVGIIPQDWHVTTLGDIGQSLIGLTYKPDDISESGILVLRSSNIRDWRLSYDDNVYVEMELPERVITKEGDILICVRNGSRDLIGKCALIDEAGAGSAFGAFMSVLRVENPTYVFHQFQSNIIKRQINENIGATINQITSSNLSSFQMPLPRHQAEIDAIAEALSDVDDLIASLDKLIAKKRAVKTAVMQELLTGRRRLPGFAGEWERLSLGGLGRFIGGNGFPTRFQGLQTGDYPFFKVSDMNSEGNTVFMRSANNWISREVVRSLSATVIPPNSIVFAKIGAAIFLERKRLLNRASCIDNNMMAFVPDEDAESRYLYYLFQTVQLGTLVKTTALPSLSGKDIAALEFLFPSPDEQHAISEVLSDIDGEIVALEARRDKTKAIKQGMMQELLTGRVRLV